MSIDWRASLVPAAAVIPAPIAYANAVGVKKLVVGLKGCGWQWPGKAAVQQVHACLCLFALTVDQTIAIRSHSYLVGTVGPRKLT